jgi:hypothetical protein
VEQEQRHPVPGPVIEPEVVSWEVAAVLARKTPTERLRDLQGMWRFARRLCEAGVRMQHPDWADAAVEREIARRIAVGSG